jgi:hypothetical protein
MAIRTPVGIFKELYGDKIEEFFSKDKDMPPEKKFKAGDKVRSLYDIRYAFTKDKIYTVVSYGVDYPDQLKIELDDGGSKYNGMSACNFELVVEKKAKPKKKKIDQGWGF